MSKTYSFLVAGKPVAQPRARVRMGRGRTFCGMYDPGTADNWRNQIALQVARIFPMETITGACHVSIAFTFRRPKSHFRANGEVKQTAPKHHTQKPDRDNLEKAVLDALVRCNVLADDCLVIGGEVTKNWGAPEGARIIIAPLEEPCST